MGTSESEMYWYSSILILLLLLHSKSINLYWYSLNLTNFQYKSDKITCQISKIYYQIIYWCCSLFDNLKSLSFMKLWSSKVLIVFDECIKWIHKSSVTFVCFLIFYQILASIILVLVQKMYFWRAKYASQTIYFPTRIWLWAPCILLKCVALNCREL